MIDPYTFIVNYNQIGNSEDLEDWYYTYVNQKIVSASLVPIKFTIKSNPKKEVNLAIKELTEFIPNGKVMYIYKEGFNKQWYFVVDQKDYTSYLELGQFKEDKLDVISISLVTANHDVAAMVEKYVQDNFSKNVENSVYVISQSQHGLTLQNLGSIVCPLQRENYSEEVLSSFDYIVDHFNRKEPYGRLAIFNGPPGTGKTWMLRSIISKIKNCIIVLLPSKLVSEIDSPQIITLLSEEKSDFGNFIVPDGDVKSAPILFIIEDADSCLVPRESDNILTISSLLNYTDGILGSLLDLRIIATTNAEKLEFDSALTRPGRLCKHVYVGMLSAKHASEVYKRLTGKDKEYKEPVALAQIYADANGGFEELKSAKDIIGFGS
jgi:ATP-dependent 26S proteasome regulatory subunit